MRYLSRKKTQKSINADLEAAGSRKQNKCATLAFGEKKDFR